MKELNKTRRMGDREEGGREAVAQEVPRVEAVFTISDLR